MRGGRKEKAVTSTSVPDTVLCTMEDLLKT